MSDPSLAFNIYIYIILGNYKGYLDSYQCSNNIRFKFCFYILIDNGLNVLFHMYFCERGNTCENI